MRKTPTKIQERYFYHSFPRRFKDEHSLEQNRKGLEILTSMANSGFLLVPEIIAGWKEGYINGTESPQCNISQKRICFTELSPDDLFEHSEAFGKFSLEYEIQILRQLSALPVFYLPRTTNYKLLEGFGNSLIFRLSEIQEILKFLSVCQKKCKEADDKNNIIKYQINGQDFPSSGMTFNYLEEFLNNIPINKQSFESLLAAMENLASLFYPTEKPSGSKYMEYYRQREWRITANKAKNSVSIDRVLTDKEKRVLLEIDKEFFGKILQFPTGPYRRVDQCKYFTGIEGRHVLKYARRVIVPYKIRDEADNLLREKGFTTPVLSLEELTN